MPEQIEQSLEPQLKMARPRRAEVKRVPLTPEEKKFLGKIMEKAVAAEKAGRLKEALDFYTDYKNEFFKIKESKKLVAEKKVVKYRSLIVKSVHDSDPPGKFLFIDFKDSVVSFQLKKKYLSERGLGDISQGDVIEIKGKKGNDDADLWGDNKIEDIRKKE